LDEKCGGYLGVELKSFEADEVPRRLPRHINSQRPRKSEEAINRFEIGVLLILGISQRLGWIDKMVVQAFGAIYQATLEKAPSHVMYDSLTLWTLYALVG